MGSEFGGREANRKTPDHLVDFEVVRDLCITCPIIVLGKGHTSDGERLGADIYVATDRVENHDLDTLDFFPGICREYASRLGSPSQIIHARKAGENNGFAAKHL